MRRAVLALLALVAVGAAPPPAATLLVVNQRPPSRLTALDPETGAERWSQPIGVAGHEVILSPDRSRAYVSIYSDVVLGRPGVNGRTIEVIDLKTGRKEAPIDVGRPVRPHGMGFGPDGLLYVTAELAQEVLVVDPGTRAVLGAIPTGQPQTHMLVVTKDGVRAFTANVDSGTVSVLDLKGRRLVKVVKVADQVQRVTLSADGGSVFTHDWRSPRLVRLDARTGDIAQVYAMPGAPFASAPTPDGKALLVLSLGGDVGRTPPVGRLYWLNLATGQVTGRLDMCQTPAFVTVSTDGRRAFVGCTGSGQVAVVDVGARRLVRMIDLQPGVDGLAYVPG